MVVKEGSTRITILQGDGYMQIVVVGHNSDPITCAGISAIMETCALGLESLSIDAENVIFNKEYNNKGESYETI